MKEIVEGEGEDSTTISSESQAYALGMYPMTEYLAWIGKADVSGRREPVWWVMTR